MAAPFMKFSMGIYSSFCGPAVVRFVVDKYMIIFFDLSGWGDAYFSPVLTRMLRICRVLLFGDPWYEDDIVGPVPARNCANTIRTSSLQDPLRVTSAGYMIEH